nr:Gag-Pol polyprotein [Tanacetum cinerariifolium]
MSTQQDIYAAGSKSRPPMLNKDNYIPWSSHLLRYAKSRPNGKLIHNSILNGPYVRKMIPEPGEEGQVVQRMGKVYFHEGESFESYYHRFLKLINDLKRNKHFPEKITNELIAKRLAKTQDPLALMANSNNPYAFPAPHQDQSSFNQNYLQQPMPNPEDITDPTTAMNMALALMAKAFKLNYSTPTNNNQRISSNPRNRAECRESSWIGNGNLVAACAEGNAGGQNGNQIRCYNCRGIEEYDLMAAAADLDKIEEVNANCILMANL